MKYIPNDVSIVSPSSQTQDIESLIQGLRSQMTTRQYLESKEGISFPEYSFEFNLNNGVSLRTIKRTITGVVLTPASEIIYRFLSNGHGDISNNKVCFFLGGIVLSNGGDIMFHK